MKTHESIQNEILNTLYGLLGRIRTDKKTHIVLDGNNISIESGSYGIKDLIDNKTLHLIKDILDEYIVEEINKEYKRQDESR